MKSVFVGVRGHIGREVDKALFFQHEIVRMVPAATRCSVMWRPWKAGSGKVLYAWMDCP